MSSLTNKIRHGDLNGVKESINCGADLSKQDRNGNTPLHIAAEEDETEIADALIKAGAPLKAPNSAGITPSGVNPGTSTTATIEEAILSGGIGQAKSGRRRPPL